MGETKNIEGRSALINELLKGKELARQLVDHLKFPSCPLEDQECLLEKILACFNHGLSVVSLGQVSGPEPGPESDSSPRIEGSHLDQSNDNPPPPPQLHNTKAASRKRKALLQWTEQVRVEPGSMSTLDGALDDGYSWRKYGQKDILGAKFPRSYYRCTHGNTRGCLAKKQVQRSDEDSTMVEIIYRGHHTCNLSSRKRCHQPAPPPPPPPPPPSQAPTMANNFAPTPKKVKQIDHSQEQMLSNFAAAQQLRVKTEDLDVEDRPMFPSFSFSSLTEPENFENFIFCPENNMMDCSSPDFGSPETSGSCYFPALKFQGLGSDYGEVVSVPGSVTSSPIGVLDLSLDQLGIDPNFPFDDHPELFSV